MDYSNRSKIINLILNIALLILIIFDVLYFCIAKNDLKTGIIILFILTGLQQLLYFVNSLKQKNRFETISSLAVAIFSFFVAALYMFS